MYSPLFVTLMGIGTVFFGLICIIVLTTVMGSVLKSKSKPAAPRAAEENVEGGGMEDNLDSFGSMDFGISLPE